MIKVEDINIQRNVLLRNNLHFTAEGRRVPLQFQSKQLLVTAKLDVNESF